LEFIHVFALANVLKRPVLIFASDADTSDYGQGELVTIFRYFDRIVVRFF
jgi:hypothetical protein